MRVHVCTGVRVSVYESTCTQTDPVPGLPGVDVLRSLGPQRCWDTAELCSVRGAQGTLFSEGSPALRHADVRWTKGRAPHADDGVLREQLSGLV